MVRFFCFTFKRTLLRKPLLAPTSTEKKQEKVLESSECSLNTIARKHPLEQNPLTCMMSLSFKETQQHGAQSQRAHRDIASGGISERGDRYRSLPPQETSPIDNAIIEVAEPAMESLVRHGYTPNHLSILGGILAFASLVCLWCRQYVFFVALFWLSYVMDALDGWQARTFRQFSPYGEALDHWKDIVVGAALGIIVLIRVPVPWYVKAVLFACYLASGVAEGCSQRAIEDRKIAAGIPSDNVLDVMARACPPGADPTISRWFATPTFVFVAGCAVLAWRAHAAWSRKL